MEDEMIEYSCTLDASGVEARLPADRALAAMVEEVERTDTGAIVRINPHIDAPRLVDIFIAHERQCCGFFELARRETREHVELVVDAPDDPTAQGLVDQLVDAMCTGGDDG